MVSSTPELVRRTIPLPEQYVDLATCLMTVVHDLVVGNSERYQEKVTQLAESYFVLMLESLRDESEVMVAAPGVIRVLSLRASSSDGNLARIPHTSQLVEAVFEQFEVRLWGLIRDAFSSAVTFPDKGPCDFIVPVISSLIKDRIQLVEYDNVSTLKESTRLALSTMPQAEFDDCIIRFGESMLGMLRGIPHTARLGNELLAFVSELQHLSSGPLADRLEPIRLELSEQQDQVPFPRRASALN